MKRPKHYCTLTHSHRNGKVPKPAEGVCERRGVPLLTMVEHKFTETIIFSPSWEKPLHMCFIDLSK